MRPGNSTTDALCGHVSITRIFFHVQILDVAQALHLKGWPLVDMLSKVYKIQHSKRSCERRLGSQVRIRSMPLLVGNMTNLTSSQPSCTAPTSSFCVGHNFSAVSQSNIFLDKDDNTEILFGLYHPLCRACVRGVGDKSSFQPSKLVIFQNIEIDSRF